VIEQNFPDLFSGAHNEQMNVWIELNQIWAGQSDHWHSSSPYRFKICCSVSKREQLT